jgi:hypothetical protein
MRAICILVAGILLVTACLGQESGPAMGAPADGATYTVVSSKEVTKADSADCGFNDVSAPKQGVFNEELREYTEFKDGKVVRTWRQTEDVFLRCYEP